MTQAAQVVETPPVAAPIAAPAEPSLEELAAALFKPEESAQVHDAEVVEEIPPVEEPKPDRVGARIAAAKRAEQRAEQQRLQMQAENRRIADANAQLDAREKRIKLIEDDPVRFFEEFKSDPKTFLEKLAGEHKPENVASKKLSAVEQELKDLKDQLANRDAAAVQAQNEGAWKVACDRFISHVGEQAEKYPHLTNEFTEDQATQLAHSVLTEVVGRDAGGRPVTRSQAYFRENGVYPDHDVIAEHLDGIAKARVEARTNSPWRKLGNGAAPASQAAPNGDLKTPATPVKVASPRTLTSREASQRVAAQKPWSQEAADEESLRILEAAFRKG